MNVREIQDQCSRLASLQTRGDLGSAIADILGGYSPQDIRRMEWNLSRKVESIDPGYRRRLVATIRDHLQETYRIIRAMDLRGEFSSMPDRLPENAAQFFEMTAAQCSKDDGGDRHRFLKFLLAGFCIFVQRIPPHPVGMPFPGGDTVHFVDGEYYCPVRTKANDIDSALCPFCPALQTPESGYLRPPREGSERRKQEYLQKTFDYHHYNG